MNCEEEKAVKELEVRVKNDLTPVMRRDTTTLYRFLKARDFNVDKAEKLLRKHIIWRKIYQVDTILKDFKPNEFFEKYAEPSLIGYDKDGDLVLYSPAGTFSIYEIYQCVKMNDFMKHWIWFAEKNIAALEEHNKNTGNHRYQACVIVNLDRLTLRNAASKLSANLFLRFVHMYQDNYPERMKYVFIINAPSYYMFVYSVMKTVMSSISIQKFHIMDSNSWKEILLEYINPDVLPAFLGGNRTDPDGNPLCRSFITPGGKIPEMYFLTEKARFFKSNEKVEKITVSSGEKKEINVNIDEAGLLLQWEFFVLNKDIGFGIFYLNSEHEMQEVIPVQRYDTSDGTEKDSYKCLLPGTYIIIFDNCFSWFSSKTVKYSITIETPAT